jgi:hypothetical protein
MPGPFIGDAEVRALREEIVADGFEADQFIASGTWPPTWGLNLAVGWPLAVAGYDELADALANLDEGLFVYPRSQTHVTVLTLVSFKEHVAPDADEVRALETLIPLVNEAVAPLARGLSPFSLEVGPPVLSRRAVFVPLRDAAGTIARFRAQALEALAARLRLFAACRPPVAIHATIARFRRPPAPDFAARFDAWAAGRALGPFTVGEILVTTETRPYMHEGRVAGSFPLGGGNRHGF